MNPFRPDTRLDRKYLRVCAVYRLLERGAIGKSRALALLEERAVPNAGRVIEIWAMWPIKGMLE